MNINHNYQKIPTYTNSKICQTIIQQHIKNLLFKRKTKQDSQKTKMLNNNFFVDCCCVWIWNGCNLIWINQFWSRIKSLVIFEIVNSDSMRLENHIQNSIRRQNGKTFARRPIDNVSRTLPIDEVHTLNYEFDIWIWNLKLIFFVFFVDFIWCFLMFLLILLCCFQQQSENLNSNFGNH